jgi:hypothetical protein
VDDPTPRALCRGRNDLFLSDRPADQQRAARYCAVCPARAACHDIAARWHPTAGVWAGTVRTDATRTTVVRSVRARLRRAGAHDEVAALRRLSQPELDRLTTRELAA